MDDVPIDTGTNHADGQCLSLFDGQVDALQLVGRFPLAEGAGGIAEHGGFLTPGENIHDNGLVRTNGTAAGVVRFGAVVATGDNEVNGGGIPFLEQKHLGLSDECFAGEFFSVENEVVSRDFAFA